MAETAIPMNVVRCPRCNAATWEPHCEKVWCGWVVCCYCERAIYDWEARRMVTWE